ncbi:hypothetical protein K439DRAFT_1640168 [Ramaria rubella]|nr:hypothetical protein K439DRAFT_1640168 [Ramaria rubella]
MHRAMVNRNGFRIVFCGMLDIRLLLCIICMGQLSGGVNGNWNTREWFPALVGQVVGGAPDNAV